MTKDEAVEYCYKHREEYLRDGADQRQFDCLVAIIESGTISPAELPDYGMNYG